MSWYSVDVECDGPVPGRYSMLSIGVVKIVPDLGRDLGPGGPEGPDTSFYAELRPISDEFDPEALAVSGLDRETLVERGTEPTKAMGGLADFLDRTSVGRPVFVTDNPGFDFAFVNWYFHTFHGSNPFGWSARRIGDLWAGMQGRANAPWKHLRTTVHSHHALDDARGNAEAVLAMVQLGLAIELE